MELSETSSNKKIPLEELSKDELIKKCNNFLIIAKKAKQAKDESSEELKKYKENEMKLSSDVAALKEVVESFNKRQHEFAEVQNKHKIGEEKYSELQKDFQKLQEKYACKIAECSKLDETLKKLSDKISTLEISNSEYIEKLNDFKENYAKVDIDNKINVEKLNEYQKNERDLRKKLQMTEEKYLKLELTLKEFQGKYVEECKNHEELQETLTKLQNRSSSGRCSSRSSDSLKPVYENQEYDEILEKYNDLAEKNKILLLDIEKLNKKLHEQEDLVKEWSIKYNNVIEKYKNVPENWNELISERRKLDEELRESNKLKEMLKEKELECGRLVAELNLKNESVSNEALLIKENEVLMNKLKNLEISHNKMTDQMRETAVQYDNIKQDFNLCQLALSSVQAELEQEHRKNIERTEELDAAKKLLHEKNKLHDEKLLENEKLTDQLRLLEESSNELKGKLCEVTEKHDTLFNQLTENGSVLEKSEEMNHKYSCEIEKLSNALKEKEAILTEEKERSKEKLGENQRLLKKLKENETFLIELKKNYESAIYEKDKLIEICQSDKSTEEIFKENIAQLKEELMTLREENDVADKRYKEMEQKLDESRVISELLKKEIDGKCDEYDAFKKEMDFYKYKNDELNREISALKEDYSSCKNKCDELKKAEKENMNLVEQLRRDLKSAKDELKGAEEKLRARQESEDLSKVEKLEKVEIQSMNRDCQTEGLAEFEQAVCSNNKLVEENENLKEEIGEMRKGWEKDIEASKEREGELKQKIISLYRAMREMKALKGQVNKEVQNCLSSHQMHHAKTVHDITRNINEVFHNWQNGNSELLSEMNDMNQVLKERGETISKLEQLNEIQRKELAEANEKISQLDLKLSEKKNKLKFMVSEFEQFKVDCENKEKVIKEMEDEIWKLKNSETPGEALSSSTLSRVEEAARLMDLEETFEERYSKLKVFAAKLKKKVSEQQKQLEEERNKAIRKSNEFQNKIANFQSQIKSLMNLQLEYDKLQDSYEAEKNDRNLLRKALESANEKIESLRQEVEDLKKEKDKFLNDKINFENIKKKLSAQIITLKQSVEDEKSKQTKMEKEIEKIDNDRTLKERKLEEEKEKHKATIALLDKQKMETKNLGVLKLEIAEYEKSVGDLEKRLAMKEEDVKELNCLLDNQRSQCKLYLDEITHLKSQLTEENERATHANNQMKKVNEESNNREVEFKEKLNEIGNLKSMVEEKTKEVEELSLELAKVSKEKLKIEEKCKNIQDHSSREIHSLQDTAANLQDSLNQRDLELSELKKEFEAYKVRAQSVLRQSQKEMNQSKQRNVIEELEQLRSTSDSLKARLEDSGLKMQKLVEENEVFQEEKNRLYSRIQELKNSLAELRSENQELKQSKQKELEQHNEALRLQKLQSETLAHCFQKKIEELEENHKTQVQELMKENEQMQKQFEKILLSTNEKTSERRDYHEHKRNSSGFIPVKSEKELLDVMLLEREECEGSESVDSISPQAGNNTNLIPLDQLLNSSDNIEQAEEKRSPMQDINQLNEKLEKSENRIKHLTVLLSEAETDCARLQHLNDVLKEEIRRNQRNIEREQHAQNFEYMKNVVLKFISLHSSDEKIRLVPVLNTILKLSPEEENVLANAARGVVEHSNSNRGWGSYLNIWPSGQ